MKKLELGFIKIEFEKEGYILLSKKYVGAHHKLECLCFNGHRYITSWTNWQHGRRCPYCAGQGKPTIEFIRKKFENEGYILLIDKYKNSRTKLNYKCPNNHKHSITWHNWNSNGERCPYCVGNNKQTINIIRSEFEKEKYILKTIEYKNCKQKLDYICPEGHDGSISWDSWKNRNSRCNTCGYIKSGKASALRNSGPNHPHWKGGISCEPYCGVWLDKDFKESIKQRDGYRCMNPCCNSKNPNDLAVHHIDYNKKSCGPENLITVCRSCNSKANKNRDWHTAWYKAIMHKRYGYVYFMEER